MNEIYADSYLESKLFKWNKNESEYISSREVEFS